MRTFSIFHNAATGDNEVWLSNLRMNLETWTLRFLKYMII